MSENGYIGVDLDGTLAHYDTWRGIAHIGEPIPSMLIRVMKWLADGVEVRIITARAGDPDAIPFVQAWCLEHIGVVLPVSNAKTYGMIALYDDRAVQVVTNTGETVEELLRDARRDYAGACQTVVLMHEAATGRKGEGPRRGVVEDCADVRAERDEKEREITRLLNVVCDTPACTDAIIRNDDGSRVCASGHRARWVNVDLLTQAESDLAAKDAEAARLREVLDGVASPLHIDGENHMATVKHARAALAQTEGSPATKTVEELREDPDTRCDDCLGSTYELDAHQNNIAGPCRACKGTGIAQTEAPKPLRCRVCQSELDATRYVLCIACERDAGLAQTEGRKGACPACGNEDVGADGCWTCECPVLAQTEGR